MLFFSAQTDFCSFLMKYVAKKATTPVRKLQLFDETCCPKRLQPLLENFSGMVYTKFLQFPLYSFHICFHLLPNCVTMLWKISFLTKKFSNRGWGLPSKLAFKLPLRSRSSTQKAPRDTLVYLRLGSCSPRCFIRYLR